MFRAFRIITFLLAGMGCGLASSHIMAPPVSFIPPALWQLVSVLTWAGLWLLYLFAAMREVFHAIRAKFAPAV